MFNLIVPLLALIAIQAPTPALAASEVTDISSAARKNTAVVRSPGARVSAKPTVRINRAATVRTTTIRSTTVRGPAVRGPTVRGPAVRVGPRGVTAVRMGGVPAGRLAGPGRVNVSRAAFVGPSVALRGNRYAAVYAGQRRLWWGGRWRSFVPLAALGVVAVGGAYYWPQAYVSVARPYCEGVTPNGCRLNWQMVQFDDGDGGWQCVQYCPRPGVMAPPNAVAFTPAPPPPQGRCDISIFSEPQFGGNPVPTNEDQPRLSESGWQNQIASVQIKAGTWDMFAGEQFSGETMRLAPGSYPDLGPDWSKKVSSFMCVEPSN